ncbi:FixH family protein [Paenalcaligenes niemegkensis]|uniref:FixH family protein n=1 Tax=Paenalcaligenes niemegkensis TaxID=2895469 RepID=UPI001EE7F287|nr:FixH family protein [Paenalcaligenes niemegkensis]MCQ9616759.1 FixH family protein [Paenalcaligenes niemegkensis]
MPVAVKNELDDRPWYREPWPWILMAGPAIVIVACIITISLALKDYGAQPINDGGVKRGLVVSKQESEEKAVTSSDAQP